MKSEIRKRKIEDSEELAHAIAVVWNTTYKGIVDEDFLIELFENATNYERIVMKPGQFLSEALQEYGINLNLKTPILKNKIKEERINAAN